MSQWECRRCKHTFATKQTLANHLYRRSPCTPHPDASPEDQDPHNQLRDLLGQRYTAARPQFPCPYCKQTFAHLQNRCIHLRSCKAFAATNDPHEQVRARIDALEETVARQSGGSNIVNNNTLNITNHNNIHIHLGTSASEDTITLRPFGQETLSHITEADKRRFLMDAVKGILAIVRKIHFDQTVPENRNVRHKSKKQKRVEVYGEDCTWQEASMGTVYNAMIKRGNKILSEHFMEHRLSDPDLQERDEYFRIFLTDVDRFCNNNSKANHQFWNLRADLAATVQNETLKAQQLPHVPQTHVEPSEPLLIT